MSLKGRTCLFEMVNTSRTCALGSAIHERVVSFSAEHGKLVSTLI